MRVKSLWLKYAGLCAVAYAVISFAATRLFLERNNAKTVCESEGDYMVDLVSLQRNTSVVFNTTLWREEQLRRKRAALQYCKTHEPNITETVVYSDKQKLIMCVMAKVASTAWRRLYFAFELGIKKPRRVHGLKVFHYMQNLSKPEFESREYEYFSFVLTRHPFTRLVSVFREKIEGKTKYRGLNNVTNFGARSIVGVANGTGRLNRPLTFEEFSQMVASGTVYNGHWAPMTSMCSPCDLQYDYFAKFETMDMDNIMLYALSGLKDRFQIPERQPKSTAKLVESYFRNLTDATIQGLYEYYKDDFLAYDFEFPDYAKQRALF